jgi:hypothetical protein
MLRLAVVTPNPVAADAIEMLTMDSGAFRPCYKLTPVPHPKEVVRALTVQNPAIVLLDLGDWIEAAGIAREIDPASAAPAASSLTGLLPRNTSPASTTRLVER